MTKSHSESLVVLKLIPPLNIFKIQAQNKNTHEDGERSKWFLLNFMFIKPKSVK